MIESKSSGALSGKLIVVTRAPEQAGELARLLEAHGAEVLLCPLVAFGPPPETAALDSALRRLGEFDWLVFSSQNAVRFFEERRRELEVALVWGRPRVAAVGPATAQAAREFGYCVEHVAGQATGMALAAELNAKIAGKSVLLPRSDRARPDLPEALRAAGAEVIDVVTYLTIPAGQGEEEALARIRAGEVDAIILASPSAFERLAEQLGGAALEALTARVALAAIGPVTAAAIRQAGLPVAVVPRNPSAASFVEALAAHFANAPGVSHP
jgi:uroporphyrinogen-III synthase/uroporphyrinogen III methyltransferase/synthase